MIRGVTTRGGANGAGTLFKYTPDGRLTAVVSFSQEVGIYPAGSLLRARDGNFYGTTAAGGSGGGGTVFRLTADDQFTTLRSFSSAPGEPRTPRNGLTETETGDLVGILRYGPGS